MNIKDLSTRDLAQIKRIAQNVDADFQAVCKLNEKIAELTKKRDDLQRDIDEQEIPVVRKTGGLKSTDIYAKTIIPQFNADGTPKVDKDGRQLKVTKYVLRPIEEFPQEEAPASITSPAAEENESDLPFFGTV